MQKSIGQVLPAPLGWHVVRWYRKLDEDGKTTGAGCYVAPLIGWAIQQEGDPIDGLIYATPIFALPGRWGDSWGQFRLMQWETDVDREILGFLDPGTAYNETDWLPRAQESLQYEDERRAKQ